MDYIKIYENFLKDRNKLLDDIQALDNDMLNEILDLIPDILDTGCVDYEFRHESMSLNLPDRYELKLFLNYYNGEFDPVKTSLDYQKSFDYTKNFFKKYLSVFKTDLRRIDSILNDYDIKYYWEYKVSRSYKNTTLEFKDSSFLDQKVSLLPPPRNEFFYTGFQNLKIVFSLK